MLVFYSLLPPSWNIQDRICPKSKYHKFDQISIIGYTIKIYFHCPPLEIRIHMCWSISALPTFPTWLRILGVIGWWYMHIVYISASFRGFWQSFTAILSEYKPCFVSYYDLNFELKAYSLCKPNWLVYKRCPCFPAILTRCIKCQC